MGDGAAHGNPGVPPAADSGGPRTPAEQSRLLVTPVPAWRRAMRPLLLPLLCALLVAAAHADHLPTGRGERIPDYRHALPLVWGMLYRHGGETLYCALAFGRDKGRRINVEHVFPVSWVARHLGCGRREQCRERSVRFNLIEADLHNLWPARRDVNEARRSHPFGILEGEHHSFAGCDFEVDEGRRLVEPRPAVRGEIARSMFYMSHEYGLPIYPRQGRLLQQWSRDDPVSDEERRRNDVIERLQGNRNSYIDDPYQADSLRF